MRRFVWSSVVAFSMAAVPAAAQSAPAQQAPNDSTVSAVQSTPTDSAVTAPVAGAPKPVPMLSLRSTKNPDKPVPLAPHASDPGAKMMVFGGVAILVGAVVGGDAGGIIMVGGACIGLYGLWIYLN